MVLVLLAPLPCMPPFGYAGASFVGQQHHQQHQQQQHQQQRGPGGGRRPDPTCFTADVPQFTVERCCNSALGADGDVTCWGGGFGFARCCPDPNAPPVDGRGRGGRGSGGERLGGFNGQGEDIKKRKIVQADFLKNTDPLLSRMELLKKFHARQQRIGKVLESSGGTGGKLNDFKLNDDSPETQKPTGQKFFSKLFPAASSGQAKPEQTRAASTSMDNMRKQPRRKKGRVTLDDVRAACPGELKVCEENGNNCGNEIKLSLKGELVGPPSPELRAVMKCYEPRRRGAPLLLGKSAPAQCLAAPGVPDRLVSFCNALCQRPSAVSNRCPPMSCCEQCVKSSGAISFDAPEPWEPQLDHSPGLLGLTDIEAMVPFNDDLTGDEGHQGWCTELRYLEDVVYCTIASFIPADAHVVDGGAHWGETLRLMQASFGSSVEIHSFEAMKINFQRASRHATERTQMVNAALTDEEGKDVLTIICNSENCDNEQSTLSEDVAASNAIIDRKQRVRHEVKVPAMRLDKYLATLDQFPFFIKLDL
jgi:FkbM family methyltransferase